MANTPGGPVEPGMGGVPPGTLNPGPSTAQLIAAIENLTKVVASAVGDAPGGATGAGARAGAGGRRRGAWWTKYTKLWDASDAAGAAVTGESQYRQPGPDALPPMAKEVKSRAWRRRRRGPFWKWQRKVASVARLRHGVRAGRAASAGLAAAGKSLQAGWPVSFAVRSGLAAAAGASGPAGIALGILASAAIKGAEALNRNTKEQLEFNKHLGESSARMRAVFAQRDVQELLRNREKGDRLSTSAASLVAAEQMNKDASKETDIAWNRIKNSIGTWWEAEKSWLMVVSGLDIKSRVFNKINQYLDKVLKNGELTGLTMDQWAQDVFQEDAKARKQKDKKWDAPQFR